MAKGMTDEERKSAISRYIDRIMADPIASELIHIARTKARTRAMSDALVAVRKERINNRPNDVWPGMRLAEDILQDLMDEAEKAEKLTEGYGKKD